MSFDAVAAFTEGYSSSYDVAFLTWCYANVTVIDTEGDPITGATVEFGVYSDDTDGTGQIDELHVPEGTYAFVVSKTGYRTYRTSVTLDRKIKWTVALRVRLSSSEVDPMMDVVAALKEAIDDTPAINGMTGWQDCIQCYEKNMPDLYGSGLRTVYICPTPTVHQGEGDFGQGLRSDGSETHTYRLHHVISIYPCVTIEGKGASGLLTDDEGLEALTNLVMDVLRFNDLDGLVEWLEIPIGIERDVGLDEHAGSFYHKMHRIIVRAFMGEDSH